MPSPLPPDVLIAGDTAQSTMYPSTGVLDSIALIAISLRRPDLVPRALMMFNQMLALVKADPSRQMPEAEIWGKVIEGVASLGKEGPKNQEPAVWLGRAEKLIGRWESINDVPTGSAALQNDGIKIYQGWMSGLLKASASLDPLLPYIGRGRIPVADILGAIDTSNLPLAYEALLELGRTSGENAITEQVQELMGIEQEQRQQLAREIEEVDEVMPVLDVSTAYWVVGLLLMYGQSAGKTFSRKKPLDMDTERAGSARFAVANLRKNLGKISSSSIAINRQRDLEHASYDAARAELEHAAKQLKDVNVADQQALHQGKLQSWMHDWYRALTARLRDDVTALREKLEGKDFNVVDVKTTTTVGMKEQTLLLYLTLLPPEKLALITVLEVMRMSGSGGVVDGMKALRGMTSVGRAVETEYRAETIKNVAGVDSPHWLRTIDQTTQRPTRALVTQAWQRLGNSVKSDKPGSPSNDPAIEAEWKSVWTPNWSQNTHLGVGGFLLDALLAVAKITRKGRDPVTGEPVYVV